MNYYYDFEFYERTENIKLGWFKKRKPQHITEPISVGFYCEDGREYYAVFNDFDVDAAWNSYQLEQVSGDMRNKYPEGKKINWLRHNVLKPIFFDLYLKEFKEKYPESEFRTESNEIVTLDIFRNNLISESVSTFKILLEKYGQTKQEVGKQIKNFCRKEISLNNITTKNKPILYGYYSAYDHYLLCSLFGSMLNLPEGFPWITVDLKQTFDELQENISLKYNEIEKNDLKKLPKYPKQINEHNALADAKWNCELHKFLNNCELGKHINMNIKVIPRVTKSFLDKSEEMCYENLIKNQGAYIEKMDPILSNNEPQAFIYKKVSDILFENDIIRNTPSLKNELERFNHAGSDIQLSTMADEAKTTEAPKELTFGQKAVGITFNPGGNEKVNVIKQAYADIIDVLDELRNNPDTHAGAKRHLSAAITDAETAQMRAVKGITWED